MPSPDFLRHDMKTMIMKRSGKRLVVSDRKAAIYVLMGIAFEDLQPVVKVPLVKTKPIEEPEPDPRPEPQKPIKRRRYRRRDMRAEESNCFQESNE